MTAMPAMGSLLSAGFPPTLCRWPPVGERPNSRAGAPGRYVPLPREPRRSRCLRMDRCPGGPARGAEGPVGEHLVTMVRVNKRFGPLHVLKDIDLEVSRGEVVVV